MGFLDFIPIVGDLIEGVSSARQSRRERRFMADQAANAHQTEVKDLRLAGLNPILSATGGGGTQAGGYSQPQTPNLSESLSSALQNKKQRELLDAQISLAGAQTSKTLEEKEGINLANTDKQNELDAKWGTGGKPGQVYAENQAKLEEAKSRILESRQRVSSAKESTRKEKLLNDVIEQNPKLKEYVLSASYAEQETINRALSETSSPAEFFSLLKQLVPLIFK